MNVFEALTKEHELFHQLLKQLEYCLKVGEQPAREDLRRILLILFPALKRHQEIEDLIFEDRLYRSQKAAHKLLALAEEQHHQIEMIENEVLKLLGSESWYDFTRLKELTFTLCESLRLHFHAEEKNLWPHYNQAMNKVIERSIETRAWRQVRWLEREIEEIECDAVARDMNLEVSLPDLMKLETTTGG